MQDKLQKMPYTQHLFAISVSDLRTLFCRKNYLCTFCHKKNLRTLFLSRTRFTFFFFRENNLRTSSGKFLRVESRHPESSDFLGLWPEHMRRSTLSLTNIFCNHFPGRRSHLSTQKMQSKHVTMYAPITGKIVFQV